MINDKYFFEFQLQCTIQQWPSIFLVECKCLRQSGRNPFLLICLTMKPNFLGFFLWIYEFSKIKCMDTNGQTYKQRILFRYRIWILWKRLIKIFPIQNMAPEPFIASVDVSHCIAKLKYSIFIPTFLVSTNSKYNFLQNHDKTW